MTQQRDGGVLFRNRHKADGDNRPNMKGFLTLDGKEYEIAAWRKESEKAGSFLSLSVKPKTQQEAPQQTQQPDDSSDLPF